MLVQQQLLKFNHTFEHHFVHSMCHVQPPTFIACLHPVAASAQNRIHGMYQLTGACPLLKGDSVSGETSLALRVPRSS